MTAQVGPENRAVCRLVYLDAEIEKPRTIAAVTMQQHHRRRAFRAFEQPAARLVAVERGPTLIRDFERASTDARERLRRHHIRTFGRTRNAVDDKGKRPHDSQHNYQRYWQERLDESFTNSSSRWH